MLVLVATIAVAAPGGLGVAQESVLEVGQPAPEFSLESVDGELHSLADLRGEKALVLLFFRGTW